MTRQMLTCQRDAFSLPRGEHYLNCAYMSPLPRAVEEAGIAGLLRKRNPASITPDSFFTDADRARAAFGKLVNAAPQRIALVPAVSYGMAVVARNTVLRPGQNVVVTAEQFPSNVHVWRSLCEESGAELRVAAPPGGPGRGAAWNEAILESIDGDTALVALPHVHWTDGTLFDLEAVGARAREIGAALVVDGTQSVGALPFDVDRVQPDALVCAAYKWLLGPYSLGVMYLGDRYASGRPLEETWLGRAGSEDFRALVDYRDEYQPGAARFDVGERSNFALLPMLIAAIELLLQWDPAAIQEYCQRLTESLVVDARDSGFGIEEEGRRAAHLFGIRTPPHLDLAGIQQRLVERRVFASLRGSALRISPHLYNDEDDLSALRSALLG